VKRSFWITVTLGLACGAIAAPTGAQFIIDHETSGKRLRGLHGPSSPAIKRSFESDREAAATFREILAATGIPGVADRIQVRASAETANAEAQIGEDGQRYIFYNSTFMRELGARSSKYWSLVFVIAHEVGHHIAGHLDFAGQNHRVELEADRYAGFILGRMGSSHAEAIAAIGGIGTAAGSETHPPHDQRVQIVSLGWNDGAGGAGQRPRPPSAPPQAQPTPPFNPPPVAAPGPPAAQPPAPSTGAPPAGYAFHSGTRIEGNLLKTALQANVEACQALCDQTAACVGYQFGGLAPLTLTCQLFDQVTGRAFDKSWRSGVRGDLAQKVSVLPSGPPAPAPPAAESILKSLTKSTPLSIFGQPPQAAPPPPKSVDAPLRFGYRTRTHVAVDGDLIKENKVDSPLSCLLVCMNTSQCTAATFVAPASGQGPCKVYREPVNIKSDQPGDVTVIHKP
jgi:PAN domain